MFYKTFTLLLFLTPAWAIEEAPREQIIHTNVNVKAGRVAIECTAPSHLAKDDFSFLWYVNTTNEGLQVSGTCTLLLI
jgi:hypothetical protein